MIGTTNLALNTARVAPTVLLVDFEKRNPSCVFSALKGLGASSVTAKSMADQLRKRIFHPYKINQSSASLCGPNVIMRCLAESRPFEYISYVLNLYEFGEAQLGDLFVKPSKDCLNATNTMIKAQTTTTNIAAADWIALASLRDSTNSLFDYQSASNQISGITLPSTVEGWFNKIGFLNVFNETNLFLDKDIDTLVKAQKAYTSGQHVCLFISAKVVSLPLSAILTPNHWVVLSGDIKVDGKPLHTIPDQDLGGLGGRKIEATVSTWGRGHFKIGSRNSASTMTVDDFTDYFYGFISAK